MVAHISCSQSDDGRSTSSPPCLGVVGGGVAKPSHHAPVLKKGPWTAAEDAILMEYVKKHGEGNWNAVQKNTSLVRCGKSCRLRWTNHLRPNLRKGSFTDEEERLILQLHSQLGNKWARMAAQLPGRTDNEIKNYWNTRIKRRIRQGLPLYNPHDGNNPQEPPTQPPETQSATTSFRPRPRIDIPTRNFSQQQSTSPVGLHPLKTIYNNMSIFDPSFSSINFNNFNPRYTDQTLNQNQNQNPNLNPYFPLTSSFEQSMFPTNPNSFQFTRLGFNMNSPQSLHTLFEAETGLSDCPIYSVGNKELPSNQMYLFQTDKLETEATAKPETSRGLLEDLFKEAEAFISPQDSKGHNLFNFQDDKFDSSLKNNCGWGTTVSDSLSAAGSSINVDTKESISIQEDLSKLINFPASSSSLTPEHCNGNGVEDLGGQSSPGYASGLTDDGLGLEMQHIASLFQTDYSQTGDHASYYWNNLPRIC